MDFHQMYVRDNVRDKFDICTSNVLIGINFRQRFFLVFFFQRDCKISINVQLYVGKIDYKISQFNFIVKGCQKFISVILQL